MKEYFSKQRIPEPLQLVGPDLFAPVKDHPLRPIWSPVPTPKSRNQFSKNLNAIQRAPKRLSQTHPPVDWSKIGAAGRTKVQSSNDVCQRVVDLSRTEASKNKLYFVDGGNQDILISSATAPPPEPQALYDSKKDTSTTQDMLMLWRARSKFVSSGAFWKAKSTLKEEENTESPNRLRLRILKSNLDEIAGKELLEVQKQARTEVENRKDSHKPAIATAGPNDCLGYAQTLQSLIAQYGQKTNGLIGTLWQHSTDKQSNFDHHAATVVAQDGPDAITLEAHAGKKISRPTFHIRKGGKKGFEISNRQVSSSYNLTADELKLETDVETINSEILGAKALWKQKNISRYGHSGLYESPAKPTIWQTLKQNLKLIIFLLLLLIAWLVNKFR